MTLINRPNPDDLLARLQEEEQQKARGRLKIFLGYAAGIGKTYAMLEAAYQRKAEGMDTVVGYIETHGRAETEALLNNLEIIPRLLISYHGIQLPEMNINSILERKPELVLIDELAHTNVPGLRHAKRYQDVEELLKMGIDVYTTLNVQHIESLNDVVAQITGTTVHETIPDRVIDEANDIELIDLPPEELLNRLKEGKVYIPEQAERAIQKFFRRGNLTALRELSMRRAAERVDRQMQAYMQTRAIAGPWPASERLLVCISPGTLSERLIRTARRLADELKAEWFALYVETPQDARMRQDARDRIARLLQLAEELGAKSTNLPGQSVVETIIDYARQHNITKIIIGKSRRSPWLELLRGSVVDRLIQLSGTIDIYLVNSDTETQFSLTALDAWQPHHPFRRYLWGLGLVAIASGINALIAPFISPTNLVVIYLLVVVVAALYLGRGPAILTSILSVAVFDYFFVPPFLTLAVSDTEYLLTFFGLLGVGLVISYLTGRVQEQAEAAQRREIQTVALYELGRDLTVTVGLEAVAKTIIEHISQTFSREVALFLPENGTLKIFAASPSMQIGDNELAVAIWAFEHGELAGRGTDTLPDIGIRCQPLKTIRSVIGVLGVKAYTAGAYLTPEQRRTLDAFTNQVALAIEGALLVEQARQAELLEATEKLQAALLNSISHDLRTPLVTITGALSSLEEGPLLDDEIRRNLIETAREEADRLNRLVSNLLNMTRLEAGAMRLHQEACDIQDLIGSVLEQLGTRLENRPIKINIANNLPLVSLDFVLTGQVLVNIIDNALRYSPPGSPIDIHAQVVHDKLLVSVADRGIGIPKDYLERVFDKFYRIQRSDNVSGTGLGLSISKGITEVQGGKIWAENRARCGTIIKIELPLQKAASP